jgi:hypothetical protein
MVFVALPKCALPPGDKGHLDHMQSNLRDIILATEKYGGMLAHLSSDDKGVSNKGEREMGRRRGGVRDFFIIIFLVGKIMN